MWGRVGDQSDTRPYKDNFKYLYVTTFNKTRAILLTCWAV